MLSYKFDTLNHVILRYTPVISFFLAVSIFSCTPEQEIIDDSPGNQLLLSTDTVLFDTLFTTVGSVTRRLRISNKNKQAIKIANISLTGGASSPYNIIVNGDKGFSFDDVVIFGGDSLLILVEVTIDPRNDDLPFLVKDSISINQGNFQQYVKLVSWGQDANLLNNVILNCNETWTADRPYVIVNRVLVDSLCNLTIEKGVRVLFDNNASMFVQGSLEVKGDTSEQVIFRSIRSDGIFENTAGQWGEISFLVGSKGNIINNAIISNGRVGLRIGTPDDDNIPDVTVTNTIIENMSEAGILSFTSDITAINTLIYNCGSYMTGNFAGGNYNYYHCTFTNNLNDFRRDEASVIFSDNLILSDNSVLTDNLNLELVNTIIWGNLEDELLISLKGQTNSSLVIQNNVIRSTLEDFETNDNLIGQVLNFPGFISPFQREYQIDSLSIARNTGIDIGVAFDIRGLPRDGQPDIGAFERIDPK